MGAGFTLPKEYVRTPAYLALRAAAIFGQHPFTFWDSLDHVQRRLLTAFIEVREAEEAGRQPPAM